MSNIHLNPRKSKPSWLKPPCSHCEMWEEDERPLDAITKALWNNQKIPDGIRCKYDPNFASPENMNKCPYSQAKGGISAGLYCDMCGETFKYFKDHDDEELLKRIKNPHSIDICPKCQMKKEKDLTQKRVITLLSGYKN